MMNLTEFLNYLKDVNTRIKKPDFKFLLKKHLFIKYDSKVKRIQKFDTGNEYKNYLGKTILLCKYEAIIIEILEWIVQYSDQRAQSESQGTQDDLFLTTQMHVLIERIINRYENKIMENFQQKYGALYGKEIYQVVYKYFANIHNNNIEFVSNGINQFDSSEQPEEFKIEIFIGLCHVAMDIAILHVEKTFKDLNGKVEKLVVDAINNQFGAYKEQ